MSTGSVSAKSTYDAIVVGGGHNGLVCAAYLARAGQKVLVLERRAELGGPCGTFEFMPGYRCAITNSPGSLEPRVVRELELERHGLRFLQTDPTLVHAFPGRPFIGWRDRAKVAQQLDAFAPGEAARQADLLADLERLARSMGISLFAAPRGLTAIARNIPPEQTRLFEQVFMGSLRELLEQRLRSEEARALLGMVALNATFAPPSAPGTAIGLMLRPISMASSPPTDQHDPRRQALRGSTGLPVGGMGAIIDALEKACLAHGAELLREASVNRILTQGDRVVGAVTQEGNEYRAPVVVSAVNPRILFDNLLGEGVIELSITQAVSALPMRGSAFKIALALDGLPTFADLPEGVDPKEAISAQFRVAHSLSYIETAVADGLAGRPSEEPLIWGLVPSVTSPGIAPKGRHLMSLNVWHAPQKLKNADWATETDAFGKRVIGLLSQTMPDLADRIVDHRFMNPDEIESELGLVGAHITHGDMLPGNLFGARPTPEMDDYRTPLSGLYLTGGGTWPGGYVTGVPGHNTGAQILADLSQNGQ